MTARTPIVSVVGPEGTNLVPAWGKSLLGLTYTDQAGYESDELVLRFAAPPYDLPPKGTKYQLALGWKGGRPADFGIFSVSRTALGGDPDSGEELEVTCRAADFIDKMKQTSSKHYDEDGGFGTAGSIIRDIAKEAGVPAIIPSELEKIKIPYRLRWNQSPLDFLTDLADDIGGIIKPQAGRLVVLERGGGKSASGQSLPIIHMHHNVIYAWDVDLEERTAHESAEADWFDPKSGRLQQATASIGKSGGPRRRLHPAPDETEAGQIASALAGSLNRFTGTGFFEGPGNPLALAGAEVKASGYGSDVDGIRWEATSVTHTWEPDGGWLISVDVETMKGK
ncbi:putative phage late control D protein [Roseibium sp. TrichSKD4]|uniref:phage late control D family protein n=1 Tax=Roseibium sp. TrichSKD4 TaxID=744980 RepID=UPI0001E56783|nr:contractile injection system protein, VgrG/Pvc8 family [Roseibium sp. TrichSKD4]EFO31693.1 putative phage late control D protein [Roseibium sp. TrichSKD4]